jgi:hypothetical protein
MRQCSKINPLSHGIQAFGQEPIPPAQAQYPGYAQVLSSDPGLRVTFVGVTRHFQQCAELPRAVASDAAHSIAFRCLEPQHFQPEVSAQRCPHRVLLTLVLASHACLHDCSSHTASMEQGSSAGAGHVCVGLKLSASKIPSSAD